MVLKVKQNNKPPFLGKLFHIDFGYILGRDPKPFPPPMKLSKEMVCMFLFFTHQVKEREGGVGDFKFF